MDNVYDRVMGSEYGSTCSLLVWIIYITLLKKGEISSAVTVLYTISIINLALTP